MHPPRVYLDTQQWEYLAAPPSQPGLGIDPTSFDRASRRGSIQVIASVDLVEEMVAAIHGGRHLVDRMIRPMLRLAGPRILQPLERRHPREVNHGGLLPVRMRYIPARERVGIADMVNNDVELRAIAAMVEQQKGAFKAEQEQLRIMVSTALTEAGVPITPHIVRDWFESHDRLEWAHSMVQSGVERGLYEIPAGESWGFRRIPSAYTFLCYQQARVVQTLGEGRKIKESDLADAHHAAAGPYYDVLVTDDRVLRLALDLLPSRSFDTMTSAEFSATFLTQ